MKLGRRVIGQCGLVDFEHLEHLSGLFGRGEEVDLTNLTSRQKVAVRVLSHFQRCGVPFKVLLKLREVLVWRMEDGGLAFEYKLSRPVDKEALQILRTMKVK